MEAIDTHFDGVKQLFNQVWIDVVVLTAQPESEEERQIAAAIDKKHRLGEIVFLGQSVNKCSGWISASSSEDCDIENQP